MGNHRRTKSLFLGGLISVALFTFVVLMSQPQLLNRSVRGFKLKAFQNSSEQLTGVKNVRVLCWVMTAPANHKAKAIHVKNTWGKRCDTLLFISSKNDSELPAVAVFHEGEGRQFLWHKAQGAFKLIHKNYLDTADWFLRADDDSYIIMENLKFFLQDYDPEESLYFGQRFRPNSVKGYMGGGAGYVLSKEAVKRFVQQALPDNSENCPTNVYTQEDDVLIADCLVDVGVTIVDTRDSQNRDRFNQLSADSILAGNIPPWYPGYLYHPQQTGFNCCSEALISFHYVKPSQMYVFEFLLYHVKILGLKKNYPA